MTIRFILWMLGMAGTVFVLVDMGLYTPFGVTVSAAVLGAGLGLLLAVTFSHRAARRKGSPRSDLTR